MKELEYEKLRMLPFFKGLPPLTRQSSYESRLKALGLTILADANQPQWKWMREGAHPETQVLTIWTMYWGIPEAVPSLWDMLMSRSEHDPRQIPPDNRTRLNQLRKRKFSYDILSGRTCYRQAKALGDPL